MQVFQEGVCHIMDWGRNNYSRISEANLPMVYQHMVLTIPSSMYRKCATTFHDIRSTTESRYYHMALQFFLAMLSKTQDAYSSGHRASSVNISPFLKVFLEFPPSASRPDKASCYRLHAFALHESVNFGEAFKEILETNRKRQNEARSKKRALRINPLENLSEYQLYYRINSKEMFYRCIADRISKGTYFVDHMDKIMGKRIDDLENIGHPKRVFTFKNCFGDTPTDTQKRFRDVSEYTDEGSDRFFFPSYDHVIRLLPEQFDPAVFIFKKLPDYQVRWEKLNNVKPTKPIANKYFNEELLEAVDDDLDDMDGGFAQDKASNEPDLFDHSKNEEYDIRMKGDIERQRFDEFYECSDFVIMHKTCRNLYESRVREYENTDAFCEKYKSFQKDMVEEFEARCFDQDANISDVGIKMIHWMDKQKDFYIKKHYIYDKDMSIFANMIIRRMTVAEEIFQISTNHIDFMKVMFGRLDAYRRCFKLHFNMFLTGEGATSKSFIFDIMEECSIPGTVDKLTYQTSKADAVDGNRNDLITICHEAPPGLFNTSKSKNLDHSQETMFKEKLTSCTVSCKTFFMDEVEGKRKNRITKSECIGVWFGATNDNPGQVEEALKTRFFWGNFEKRTRSDKDIDDCMTAETQFSSRDRKRKAEICLEEKHIQFRFYVIEKAIYVGIIKDVEDAVFNIIMKEFKTKIKSKCVRAFTARDTTRVKIIARIFCILTALETVWDLPGGKHYMKPFQIKDIVDIEEHMVMTEEQVRFAVTLLDSQYVYPYEHKILKTIYHLYRKEPNYVDKADSSGNPSSDYNYLQLKKMSDLTKIIQSNMSTEQGKTSKNNINSYLLDLQSKSRTVPNYIKTEQSCWAVQDPTSARKRVMMSHCSPEGISVHMSLFDNCHRDQYDPVLEAIKSIRHKHQKTKKMITGRTNGETFGNLLTYTIKKNDKQWTIKNFVYNSERSRYITGTVDHTENRQREEDDIEEDIDMYAYKKRMKTLHNPNLLTADDALQRAIDHHSEEAIFFTYGDETRKRKHAEESDIVRKKTCI